MSSNVIPVFGDPNPDSAFTPIEGVVKILRQALERAERGEVRSVVISCICHNSVSFGYSSLDQNDQIKMIGNLHIEAANLVQEVLGSERLDTTNVPPEDQGA